MDLYVPTYRSSPELETDFMSLSERAVKRNRFHERLACVGKKVTYARLREIGSDFGIPFKKLASNIDDVDEDQASFHSLLFSSLKNEETKRAFVKKEERLCLYRFRVSGASIAEIPRYFWMEPETRNRIMETATDDGLFKLDFETAFTFFSPRRLAIQGGLAVIGIDHIYQMCARSFRLKLVNSISRKSPLTSKNAQLVQSLCDTLERATSPQRQPVLTLDNIGAAAQRSFPPCMFRIYDSIKKTGAVSFKGHFELSLFLKGLGFDAQQQTDFWRSSKYQGVVNVNTIYGLDEEGKSYCPHSCVAMIIRERPKNIFQVQGCPFRYMGRSEITPFIRRLGRCAPDSDLEAIADQTPEHPQIACKLFFDTVFRGSPFEKSELSHPVEFFLEAEKRTTDFYR